MTLSKDPPGKRLPAEFTFKRFFSRVIPHVVPVRVLPVETLVAEVALVQPLPVCPHVPQQHEAAGELLLADVALERFLPGVIPNMVIQNVSSIKGLRTVGTFELLKDQNNPVNPCTGKIYDKIPCLSDGS